VTGHPRGHSRPLAGGAPPCRLIAWEVTRSCNLACSHCRAEAHPEPYPGELTTSEAKSLIDTFPEVGNPIVIFTGGDPMMRPDVYELVAYAHGKGLTCAFSPNGTLITPETARLIRDAGTDRCSISLDGPDAESHDRFRGVPGAFAASLRGIGHLRDAGVPFQINTTVTRDNLGSFRDIFRLCESLGAAAWHIFLLVPMGRAKGLANQVITAAEYENVLRWLYDFRKTTPMHLKATCAPHYYRIMRQRAQEEGIPVNRETFGMDAMTRGCLGGTGFCFISHVGQVQPCGYLELDCGNVRQTPFPQLWRENPVFARFRDRSSYRGKCGACEYHNVCGGCRARAYSMDGDCMGEEPLCSYVPRSLQGNGEGAPPSGIANIPERSGADADLDATDRRLLDVIQTDFPLDPRPYAVLGERLGIPESEVLERVRQLRRRRIIRRLGANFQSRGVGFVSTLCAAKVPADKLTSFTETVNAEPGVTHNYLRDNPYNVWFTLIAPSREAARRTLEGIVRATGVPVLDLPAERIYKIRVDFRLQPHPSTGETSAHQRQG
jgi:heme b synthase